MINPEVLKFINQLEQSATQNKFVKLTLSAPVVTGGSLKNVYVKPTLIQQKLKWSFVYRHNTNDVTQNYLPDEGKIILLDLLGNTFSVARLFTNSADWELQFFKKNANQILLKQFAATFTEPALLLHNKVKDRFINTEQNLYLQRLGILNSKFEVINGKNDKYKQINKFIEIIDSMLHTLGTHFLLQVIDVGSGKGYLTFALYDYLVYTKQLNAHIIGIELREELCAFGNLLAKDIQFKNLQFKAQPIESYDASSCNLLVALHACNTATDDALFKAISNNCTAVVVAPCCHKQLRPQISPNHSTLPYLKHGIMLERQAEMLTDSIRALILEAYGYRTKVFEFVDTEHTSKNVMITATKKLDDKQIYPITEIVDKIQQLKHFFGIKQHYLEKLLKWQ